MRISRVQAVHLGQEHREDFDRSQVPVFYWPSKRACVWPELYLSLDRSGIEVLLLKTEDTTSSFMSADSALSEDRDKEAGLFLAVALEKVFPDLEHVEFPDPAVNYIPDRYAFLDERLECSVSRYNPNNQLTVSSIKHSLQLLTLMADLHQRPVFFIIAIFMHIVAQIISQLTLVDALCTSTTNP